MPADGESWDDDPDPGESDFAGDDGLPEMACPRCRGSVTEDTQKCPHCGDWITPVDLSRRGPRRWAFVGAVLLMLALMALYALR